MKIADYSSCIANLPNSILKYFGVEPNGETLEIADKYLDKEYKNVVVLLLDGMGVNILEKNLEPEGFLRSHLSNTYSSVFPPTTVAATTSLDSGLLPIEHAWLGWDCYYPQVDKNITVFLNTEQGTTEPVAESSIARKYCGYKSIIEKLNEGGVQAYYVTPFIPPYYDSFEKVCDGIASLCREDGRKYIYGYCSEPDSTMHKKGCFGEDAKSVIRDLEERVRKLSKELEGTDTLLIITADHGHIDVRNVIISDYPKIFECLIRYPSIEARSLNLYVKEGMKEQLENEFRKEFSDTFVLLSKEEVLKDGIFGYGKPHQNVDAMIGDYLAIAKSDLCIFNFPEEREAFKGAHAGLTKDEMTIPFIVVK